MHFVLKIGVNGLPQSLIGDFPSEEAAVDFLLENINGENLNSKEKSIVTADGFYTFSDGSTISVILSEKP